MATRILPHTKAPASVETAAQHVCDRSATVAPTGNSTAIGGFRAWLSRKGQESAEGRPGRKQRPAPSPRRAERQGGLCPAAIEQHDSELWGHLGLRLPGDQLTRWYPVCQEQAGHVIRQLTAGAAWIAVETLNNRALVIQPSAVQRLVILDGNADEPEGDWALSWSDWVLGEAIYRGLWQCYLGGSKVAQEVQNIVAQHGLGERALDDALRVTRVHHRDGAATALRMDARAGFGLFGIVQQGQELPPMLLLACWGEGMDYFTPREQVALLDMPLHLMRDAQADAAAEAEAAARELDADGLADEWQRMRAA